jgi:hypothetical protein
LTAAAVAGILLLTWGWLDVRERAIPETGRLGQKTDITVYLDAGRALRAGQDIYQVRNTRNWPYLYPPLPALLFVPLSSLSRGQASYAWFLVSLGCIAGSVQLVRATLRRVDPEHAKYACWLGLIPASIPLFHTLQRGQINALPLACVCLAIYAVVREQELLAGMSLAAATAIKVTPGFAVVCFAGRWLEHQVTEVRGGRWRPGTLLARSLPLVGFGLGLVLWGWLVPAMYMGPQSALHALARWHQTAAAGYFHPDSEGNLFGDTAGIHDTSNKNQSWYRTIVSTASLLDHDALRDRDLLQPRWQQRTAWILLCVGLGLTVILLWLLRGAWQGGASPAACAGLAAFAWLGISLGKIAWGHFYLMTYPLMALAWLVAAEQTDVRQRRSLQVMLVLLTVAYVMHYSLASLPGISDIGGMLLPTTILAIATISLANRRGGTVDCHRPLATAANMATSEQPRDRE